MYIRTCTCSMYLRTYVHGSHKNVRMYMEVIKIGVYVFQITSNTNFALILGELSYLEQVLQWYMYVGRRTELF